MSSQGHEPFDGLAALYAAGALNGRERTAFHSHLEVCVECVREVKSLLPVTHGLLQIAPPVKPPVKLRTRVLSQVTGAKSPRSRQPAAPPTATAHPPGATDALARKPGVLFWLASVFAIAVSGVGGWYIAELDSRVTDLQAALDLATLQAEIRELEVAAADLEAAEHRAVLALVTAPDVQQLALAGQPLAPRASARVFWNGTGGLTLLATGLPPLPTGDLYQLWFVGPDAPVSAALVAPDPNGNATIRLTVPGSVTMPMAMALTIEPAGGVSTPTGDVYLLGRPTP